MDSELVLIEQLPLDRNPAAVYLAGLRPTGRRTQRQALNVIAGMLTGNADALACGWGRVRYQHTAAVRAALLDGYAPSSVNKMLCALRGALKAAWRLGLIGAEDYQRAVDVPGISAETLPAGRELTPGEIAALMATCEQDPGPAGRRDAAIVALLYSVGLRRDEAVRINLADYAPDTGRLVIHGKRGKQRTAYLTGGAELAMGDWLAVRGAEPGPLFLPIRKNGQLENRRITAGALYKRLAYRGRLAGMATFSPHDFRRSFVSDLLDAGADIATVAKMAGHASVTTTARYDRRGEATKRKAAGLLHVPYRGRKGQG
jgi:integrase